MIGLIFPCFNRPDELKQCLDSLRQADLTDIFLLMINDASTDEETNKLFNDFSPVCAGIMKYNNSENSGIKHNLHFGYDKCFEICDLVMNLDSDAIVKPDFVSKLLALRNEFPDNIITGFNSYNRNSDGSHRHPIIEIGDGWIKKGSVGGINMLMNKKQYLKYVKPTLGVIGNWDFASCKNSLSEGKPIVCIKPSVVQHLATSSSMGHHGTPDISVDFDGGITLKDVTLVGVDSLHPDLLKMAAEISQTNIEFGGVKLITDKNIKSKEEYCEFLLKEIYKYVDTSHLLIIQHDGFVLNWKAWDDEFLNYDYIGGTWGYKDNMNVGNGGFSLRSKKFMEFVANSPRITQFHPEDFHLCRTYRKYLEDNGFKFAPEEVANRFSMEGYGSKVFPQGNRYSGSFGFHGYNIDYTGWILSYTPRQTIALPDKVSGRYSTTRL